MGAKHGAERNRTTWKEERDAEAAELGFSTPALLRHHRRRPGRHRARRPAAAARRADHHRREERDAPATAGASATSRSACTIRSGTTICPICRFPRNWPVFSPKDKIGDWLEMYTKVMELNYWGSTDLQEAHPTTKKREWTVVVERDGKEIVLQPKQLVLATGMSGKPNMPKFEGMERFKGDQHHSSQHPGPDEYKGKKAVVIGSNNSAHDICAALWEAGVDVTMVQRSTHPYRAVGLADGTRAGELYSEQAVAVRHDHGQGRPDLRFDALQDPARVPDPGLQRDPGARRRFLRAAGEGRFHARLRRRRFRPVHEISAARLGLLHRCRRFAS